jgi:NTE family protein
VLPPWPSAGAVVGAAFAGGKVSALRDRLGELTRRGVLRLFDPAWPREGFLHGRRALEFIGSDIGGAIEDLALPYAAVATDLRTGDEVCLRSGPVFDAVRASIAIPGIFRPWRVGGRLLVDGGLVNPVPVSAARALGAEFVVALNVLPLRDDPRASRSVREYLRLIRTQEPPPEAEADTEPDALEEELGLIEVVWQASRILASQVATNRLRADPPGYLLQIPVPEVGMFDVHRTQELSEVGRRCAEQALPALREALERAVPLRRRVRAWSRWLGDGTP